MSPMLSQAVGQYFPTVDLKDSVSASSNEVDGIRVSQALYPDVTYTEGDKAAISQELVRSVHIRADEDEAKLSERLSTLNTHLSSRTTLLGSKPSFADIAMYSCLAPLVKGWSPEERTGSHGYHHVVRYMDFVQSAPLFGHAVKDEKKVQIDPKLVLFLPKPLDPKQEKERKKKGKAAMLGTDDSNVVVVGQTKGPQNDGVAKVKDIVNTATASAKDVISNETKAPASSKKEKKDKAPKAQKQPPKERTLSPAQIDLRVGHILKAVTHPNADSLFVSTIAVGDAPGTDNTSEFEGQVVRTVCSGLNGLVPLNEMQDRKIVAVCNLKPVTMRGVKSAAMVLAASPRLAEDEVDNHAGPVELVKPPVGSYAGQRIIFEGWDGEPEAVLNPKKKVWDMCQMGFTTTDDLGVAFDKRKVEQLHDEAGLGKPDVGRLRVKGGGACTVESLKGAVVR